MTQIEELAGIACKIATDKGWWNPSKTDLECILLMHTELSEAVEEMRNGNQPFYVDAKTGKPEGYVTELADCFIRILDFVEHKGQSALFVQAIEKKIAYNSTRPHRHGNKLA